MGLLVVLAVLLVQFVLATRLPPRGDELKFYAPHFEAAAAVWPGWSRDLLAHPISPVYVWIAGAVSALPGGSVIWMRLLSLAALGGCIGTCLLSPRGRFLSALIVMIHPFVLVYSVRAHPFVPAIGCLWLAWRLRRGSPWWSGIPVMLASSLQPYLAATALLWGIGAAGGRREALRAIVIAGVFGGAGVCLTWAAFGGIYPERFLESEFYRRYHLDGEPSYAYLLMVPLLGGLYLWILGRHGPTSRWIPIAIGALAISAVVFWIDPPLGPIRTATARLGLLTGPAWIVIVGMMGAGWCRLHRDRAPLAGAVIASAAILSGLPYFYERIAWFGVLPCLALWAGVEVEGERVPRPLGITVVIVSLIGYAVYLRLGSL